MEIFPAELDRGPDTVVKLETTRVLLAFFEPQDLRELADSLRGLELVVEDGERYGAGRVSDGGRALEPVNHTDRRFWIRVVTGEIDERRLDQIAERFGERLQWIGPVYRMPDSSGRTGLFCPLPDILLIRFGGGTEQQSEFAERYGLSEQDDDREFADGLGPHSYRRYVIRDRATDAYRLRAVIKESSPRGVEDIRFENMPLVAPYAMQLADPLCAKQWNMERIVAQASAPGKITGWDYSLGDSSIVIAVLDTGCDLTHPDLRILSGFSFGNPSGHGETREVRNYAEGHGTMCAGVAAATANNLKGLTGVAGRCLILPIAFKDGTDYEFFRGLLYAADRGARVASMSFSIYGNEWDTDLTSQAVKYAHDRNLVMCAASGNLEKDFMAYPASDTRVIACGASTHSAPEDRKAKGASDWGSNYGAGLSVVAPGVDVPTTTVQGRGAGGDWGADYTGSFNGTSAATPHVAGLAALILSVKPSLSALQVRHIIESTADKIGAAAFDQHHSNGTWNKFVGFGRINVLKAMRKTFAPFDIVAKLEANHLPKLVKALQGHEEAIARIDQEGGDPELRELHEAWIRLGRDGGILGLIREAAEDPDMMIEIRKDPEGVARRRGIELPDGAVVRVERRAVSAESPPFALTVRFPAGGTNITAGWDPETGFFGDIEPERASVITGRAARP
jgi:hypothetical protein